MKQVEFSKSARSSSILSGDMPGKLKSPQIIRRSAASVPRVARKEPNSSKNIDLLDVYITSLKNQYNMGTWTLNFY